MKKGYTNVQIGIVIFITGAVMCLVARSFRSPLYVGYTFPPPIAENVQQIEEKEGFTPMISLSASTGTGPGDYPASVVTPPLADMFPFIGKNQVTRNSGTDIWWKFPSFGLTSTKQLTNNLKYHRSPDNGTASRAEFSGAMYKPVRNKTNVISPMGEAETGPGVRVGYYRSEPNLLSFSNSGNTNVLY